MGQKTIWLNVRETAGLAYAKSKGNALHIQVDPGGTVVLNQGIYLRDPIGSKFADIVLPATTWGEEDFAVPASP